MEWTAPGCDILEYSISPSLLNFLSHIRGAFSHYFTVSITFESINVGVLYNAFNLLRHVFHAFSLHYDPCKEIQVDYISAMFAQLNSIVSICL